MAKPTAVKYMHKVRQRAKERTIRFRTEQEKRGYKASTIYLSGGIRNELSRLCDEAGMDCQSAMDHIFNTYQESIKNSNVTRRVVDNVSNTVKSIDENEPVKGKEIKQCEVDQIMASIPEKHRKVVNPDLIRIALRSYGEDYIIQAIGHSINKTQGHSQKLNDFLLSCLENGFHLEKEPYQERMVDTDSQRKVETIAPPKPETGKMAELNLGQRLEVVDMALPKEILIKDQVRMKSCKMTRIHCNNC